jgi:hypothetical protein
MTQFEKPTTKIRIQEMYRARPDELALIDEAIAAVARGEIASVEEVEAVFAKYRHSPLSSPGSSR